MGVRTRWAGAGPGVGNRPSTTSANLGSAPTLPRAWALSEILLRPFDGSRVQVGLCLAVVGGALFLVAGFAFARFSLSGGRESLRLDLVELGLGDRSRVEELFGRRDLIGARAATARGDH